MSTARKVARGVVLTANAPLARGRLRKAVETAPRPIKLEIGGSEPRSGWLVTNVGPLTRHYLDATITWPFEDGALSAVYADNVIEHISLEGGRAMIREAFRCLRPGGVMRLITPDLGKHVEQYLSGEAALKTELADFYRSLGLTVEHPTDLARIPCAAFGHPEGYLYDAKSLTKELVAVGFEPVIECPLGKSEHADLDGLDLRNNEATVQMAIEAIRP